MNGMHNNNNNHNNNNVGGAGGPQYPMYSAQNYMYPHSMPPMPQYYNAYPYMIPVPPPGNIPGGGAANPTYDAYYNFYHFNPLAMAVAANGGYPMQPSNIPNGSGMNSYGNRIKTKRNNNNNNNNNNIVDNNDTKTNSSATYNTTTNDSITGGLKANVSIPETPKNNHLSTPAAVSKSLSTSSSASASSAKNTNEEKTSTPHDKVKHVEHNTTRETNTPLDTKSNEEASNESTRSSSLINDTNKPMEEENGNGSKISTSNSTSATALALESEKEPVNTTDPVSASSTTTTTTTTTTAIPNVSCTPKESIETPSESHEAITPPLFFNTSRDSAVKAIKLHQSFRTELKHAKIDHLNQFVTYSRSKNTDTGLIVYPNTILKIIDYCNNSTVVTLPNSWAGPLYFSKPSEELDSVTEIAQEEDPIETTSISSESLELGSTVTSPLVVQRNWAAVLQSTPAAKKKTSTTSTKPKKIAPTPPVPAQVVSNVHSSEAFDLSNETTQPLGILLLRVMFDSNYSIFNSSTPLFDIHPRGLTNTGNICYMNSILQVLLHCEPLNKLIKLVSEMTVGTLDKSKSKTPLLDATINLFSQFQAKIPTNGTTNGYILKSVSPEPFYTKLIAHKKFQHLKWGQQEDAEEFLGYFLDALTEELMGSIGELNTIQVDSLIQLYPGDDINEFLDKVKTTMKLVKKEGISSNTSNPNNSSEVDSDEEEDDDGENGWSEVGSKKNNVSVRRNGEEEPSPLTDIFGGQFRSVLTIPKSSKNTSYLKSISLDPFRNIQLDLSESNSIEDALIHLNKIERISYKPLDNKEELVVLKQTFIDKLPQVLTIHLKRFAFSDNSSEGVNGYGNGHDNFSSNIAAPAPTAGSSSSFTSVAAATTTATTATTSTTTASTTSSNNTAPSNGRSNGYSSNYGGYGYGSGINKLRKKITYEHELTIPPQIFSPQANIVEGPRYRLIGVVYHHGSSMESGHYTCDVRVDRGPGKEEWIRIDDTLIEAVSASDVLNSADHNGVPHIQNIHLIVKQHKHKVNGKFVPDHKFGFNGGQSYLMNHKDIKLTLQKVMANAGANDDVFVSHGVGSDIKFLKLMGVLVPTDIATVDTHMLYSMSFDRYATLKQTCRSLNIPVSRMHNGGNDAYYTLLAAMKICDPNVRIKLGLDQHKVLEPRTKGEIQSLKFSDRAKVIPKEGDQVWDELKGLWNTD
ncbi:uncharacterized protein KQ657_004764 [Scheffersomyces spartinae]|uniref:ubiquitinyl hydrolase 1 n=1 Tax=Scheffersomyces spartinae TaxID=45513 RepID=A0A9P8AJ69_9ASCO|nr:uncharacterized protein KQ657_004764 [Scheffersomyces spartinae]KAG7194549.1 hypothetical protein KQ657_004764 [Scheffersomyces spartinae]